MEHGKTRRVRHMWPRGGVGLALVASLIWVACLGGLSRPAAAQGATTVSVTPSTVTIGPGATATVTVQATAPPAGLGSWTVDLGYDPAVVTVAACTPQSGSLCNPSFGSGVLRVTGASLGGLTGTVALATVTLTGAGFGTSPLTLSVVTLTDPSGTAVVSPTTANATATVSQAAAPTPAPEAPSSSGAPASVTLAVSPTTVVEGGIVSLSGTVEDPGHNPVAGATVTLTASGGSLSPSTATTTATGAYAATLAVPPAPGQLTLMATVQGTSPAVAASATVAVVAPSAVATSTAASGPAASPGAAAPATAVVPVVTAVTPGRGVAVGGTDVTISGTGFSGATSVRFGAVPASGFTVDSATEITATVPAGQGTVDVTVATPTGTSAITAADRFAYASVASTAPSSPSPPSFSDVPAGYWAASAIAELAARGIISGFPGGTFRPGTAVTRAQFVKMLVLTLGLKSGGGATPFTDVPTSAWFAPYVSAAVQAGIAQGVSSTSFAPDATVSRQQMAVLLARALKLTKTATLSFTDGARIASWATTGVEEAVAAGYISGFPDGSFQPLASTTRAQAAKVLAMALQSRAPAP